MSTKNDELYNGAMDWNEIYRTWYPLNEITYAIAEYLPQSLYESVLFAGFGQIAEQLSSYYPVHLIEYSAYMVEKAKEQYHSINRITHNDILDYLFISDAEIVCIACRISANWDHPDALLKLMQAIDSYPRKLILIDFFDSEMIGGKKVVDCGRGNLKFHWDIEEHQLKDVATGMYLTLWRGEYVLNNVNFPYKARVSTFIKTHLINYMRENLPQYHVRAEKPLIPADPGFLVVIDAR